MANLPEIDQFDAGVYQLETTDPALGGANGIMNTPPKSLVNRTRYLLNRMLDGALSFIVDSGTTNAIVAAFPQPIAALVDGMEVSFRVANATTGATTLKLINTGGPTLPTLPLYGGDHVALPGGELYAGAVPRAKLNLSLNGGNGAWVVTSITGGLARIPTAPAGDTSTLAANMAALFTAADGLAPINVGVGADITLTKTQYGNAILKLTGTPTAPINLLLPANTGQWIIWNQQGGTNNITVKPVGGTGVVLPQGNVASIICSDGSVASFASAQAGQSSFTPVTITGVTGSTLTVAGGYTPGAILIEKNGYLLEPGATTPDFTATTSPTISLKTAAVSTDVFTIYRFNTFNVANAVQKSGDVMAGSLALYGGDTIGTDPAANDNSSKIPSTRWAWNNILALVNNIIGSVTGVTPAFGDNSTKLATTAFANLLSTHGQCRLIYSSATAIKLIPFNGQNVIVNGVPQQIPAAGITISNAGLAASTFYYVYLTTLGTLAFSTTGHAPAANGVEVMAGDTTKTLVGAVLTNSSSQFSVSNNWYGVISWFNRQTLSMQPVASSGTISTNSPTEINSNNRVTFISWLGESIQCTASGFASPATAQAAAVLGIGFNSTTANSGQVCQANAPFASAAVTLSTTFTPFAATENQAQYITPLGQCSSGSCPFNVINSVTIRG